MAIICHPRLLTPTSNYKELIKKYKLIHSYPASTYLFSKYVENFPFERINIPSSCQYDLFLADEFISDRELQSLYAKENNSIHESQIYIETLNICLFPIIKRMVTPTLI